MASYYPNQFSPYPPIEGDQDQSRIHPFTHANDHTSKFPFPILLKTTHDQEVIRRVHASQEQLLLQPKPFNLLLTGIEQSENYSYNDHNTMDQPISDPGLRESNDPIQGSSKWMSSKMRIMKKMLSSEQILVSKPKDQTVQEIHDQESRTSPGAIIRVCSDCNTTKTPLWRSGPRGPKSLCNACGIRQRKARRAMAAAAVALSGGGGGLSPVANEITKVRKEKRADADCTMPFKKRCRFSNAGAAQKKLRFDDMSMHQVFPKDERDAAILLMALSCGLIHS